MADEILDATLEGKETPAPASQAQNGSQIDLPDDGMQSEEEVEFNKLSGSTQERIRNLVRKARTAQEEAELYKNASRTVPPPPPSMGEDPNINQAVRRLSEVGIATKEDVNNTIGQALSTLRYEQEMARLSSTYNGKTNEPQFDRMEYEEFVKDNPVYANYFPEDVFKMKMFPDEFLGGKQETPSEPQTLRPTRTSQQKESFSPEYIEEKLRTLPPEQRDQWYQENLSEINQVLGKMTPQG